MEITDTFGFLTVFNVVRIFFVLTLGFFVTMLLTPLWFKILAHYKIGQQIKPASSNPVFHKFHKHKEGTPTAGGGLIWFSVAIITLGFWFISTITVDPWIGINWDRLNFLSRSETWVPFCVLIVAGVLGLVDDILGAMRIGPNGGGLKIKIRVGLYLLISIFCAWWFFNKLDFDVINIPFLGDITVGLWYPFIFIFIVFASTFSANETDGLDGLAAGVLLTMLGAYGAIAFVQGRIDLVVFMAAIIGSLVAILWYNIFPAKFFMGDTGSMSLGVVIGVIAMLTNTSLLLIPIGSIFILESASVIIQVLSKKIRGKKVFLSAPIHHHFEAKGWHETTITMRFWMVSALGAIIGLIIFLIDSKIPPFL